MTALSLGGDTRLDANGVPVTPAYQIGTISAEELNDSRITHRSPRPGESPARWHQYLTGTGVYDSQQGLIDEGDSDLAMGLLESGFRDPKQIEGIVKSAKNNGIDLRKFDADRFKNNPLNEAKYSPKVQGQMQSGDYHAFPKEVDNFAGMGNRTPLVGGDGITRTKIELPGTYDGKQGHFEWIVEPDGVTINHRLFVPKR